ncbi:hypothetical protein GS399_05095 [Pedobacter sp. HMF7647]|uniref:Uncharacterized protein n=1 Tax=Hufsiella arboris TaxID=2695275 RepID=A0A7K1Y7C0_9SPHI|nr:hypothetical protein [Hufsiella arboris]MXV50340.1 hypothetical protein [Hufsiella arboris]
MTSFKILTMSLAISVFLIVLVGLIWGLLWKRFKSKNAADGNLNPAYVTWFSGLFVAGLIVLSDVMKAVQEASDNLLKLDADGLKMNTAKTILVIEAVALCWFIVLYLVVESVFRLLFRKVDEHVQMQEEMVSYFLFKGFFVVGVVYSFSVVLQTVLRLFIPSVDLPFFH